MFRGSQFLAHLLPEGQIIRTPFQEPRAMVSYPNQQLNQLYRWNLKPLFLHNVLQDLKLQFLLFHGRLPHSVILSVAAHLFVLRMVMSVISGAPLNNLSSVQTRVHHRFESLIQFKPCIGRHLWCMKARTPAGASTKSFYCKITTTFIPLKVYKLLFHKLLFPSPKHSTLEGH